MSPRQRKKKKKPQKGEVREEGRDPRYRGIWKALRTPPPSPHPQHPTERRCCPARTPPPSAPTFSSPRAPGAQTDFKSCPIQGAANLGMGEIHRAGGWVGGGNCFHSAMAPSLPTPEKTPRADTTPLQLFDFLPPKSHRGLTAAFHAAPLIINAVFCYFDKRSQSSRLRSSPPPPSPPPMSCDTRWLPPRAAKLGPGQGMEKSGGETGWEDGVEPFWKRKPQPARQDA